MALQVHAQAFSISICKAMQHNGRSRWSAPAWTPHPHLLSAAPPHVSMTWVSWNMRGMDSSRLPTCRGARGASRWQEVSAARTRMGSNTEAHQNQQPRSTPDAPKHSNPSCRS